MCNVNIATGEVTQYKFDLLLSGRIPFKLIRTYSSLNPDTGLLGVGWKLNLGTWLQVAKEGLELFADGVSVTTLPVPTLGQGPLAAGTFTIERTRSELVITDQQLNRYTFRLARETLPQRLQCNSFHDYFGNSLTYEYEQDRLVTLINSYQRRFGFSYDHVSSITACWLQQKRTSPTLNKFVRKK